MHSNTTTTTSLQKMAYQNDGSYFVESDEPSHPRMGSRDAAKRIARNRQEIIANELSRLASDEYLEDIMQHMRHMEVSQAWATAIPPLHANHA
jgi:hypothetical protein